MSRLIPTAERFSFVSRPVPVPGDLRLVWRLCLLLMMLGTSRKKKASLVKLHVLNDAVLSYAAAAMGGNDADAARAAPRWRVHVEPALARAIDFLVGDKLAAWIELSNRIGLQLTAKGIIVAENRLKDDQVMKNERAFLQTVSREVTESFVTSLLNAKRLL